MTDLTLAEAVAAIREASSDDGYATSAEIRAVAKCSEGKINAGLRTLLAQGRLSVRRVLRPTLDGRFAPVPGYKITRKR